MVIFKTFFSSFLRFADAFVRFGSPVRGQRLLCVRVGDHDGGADREQRADQGLCPNSDSIKSLLIHQTSLDFFFKDEKLAVKSD